jgi:hypothetical protein
MLSGYMDWTPGSPWAQPLRSVILWTKSVSELLWIGRFVTVL